MILWLILLLLLLLLFIWWYSSEIKDSDISIDIPTIHAKCQKEGNCGDNLICDIECRRCKQKIGGACSSDVDCQSGLICSDWKCSDFKETIEKKNTDILPTNDTKKEVRWKDVNEIFYI